MICCYIDVDVVLLMMLLAEDDDDCRGIGYLISCVNYNAIILIVRLCLKVCQGSAADLIKLAMVNIHNDLSSSFNNRNFRSRRSLPGGSLYSILDTVRLVLQIHDELVFEVPRELVNEVACIVKRGMEGAMRLKVPLKVKLSVGENWGKLVPYQVGDVAGVPPVNRKIFED